MFGILGLLARSSIGVPLIYLFPLVPIALGLARRRLSRRERPLPAALARAGQAR
jgi:hypothetical protein